MPEDPREVVQQLLARWQATPSNAIADVLDELTKAALPKTPPADDDDDAWEDVLETPRLIALVRRGNAATAAGQIARLHSKNDPRVASALLDLLEQPPWHATGSQPFWTRLFDLLAQNPDPRSAPRLKALNFKMILGKSMRRWMNVRVKRAEAVLAKAGVTSAKISTEERAALAKIRVSPASKKAASTVVSEAALFRAVYESPEADAPRAVLADYLIERGDPRGELIALQLGARSPASEKRALTLVRKYQRAWLGPFAPHIHSLTKFSVGAQDPGWNTIWWNRGFPAGGYLAITKPKLVELADSNRWSTFERLTNVDVTTYDNRCEDSQWADATVRLMKSLRGLRTLSGTSARTLTRAVKDAPEFLAHVERLMLSTQEDEDIDAAARALTSMPKLVRLYMHCLQSNPQLKPLFDAIAIAIGVSLLIETPAGSLTLTDSGTALTFYATRPAILPIAKHLAAVRAKSVRSLTFANSRSEEQQKALARLFPKANVIVLPKRVGIPRCYNDG